MKFFDKVISKIDAVVDRHTSTWKRLIMRHFAVFSTLFFAGMLAFFFYRFFVNKPEFMAGIVSDDLSVLSKIIESIDKDCNILSIANNDGVLDFLTVEKFVGSQVGCLNLAHPDKWKGPYVQRNITMQGKYYNLMKTKEGLFVIPGRGVELPSGRVMGKSLIVTPDTSIKMLLKPNGSLYYQGHALAMEINIEIGDWDGPGLSSQKMKKIGDTIDEFNKAIPLALNIVDEILST